MGDRYWITGVQLGIIKEMLREIGEHCDTLDKIMENQYIGTKEHFEKMHKALKFVEHIENHLEKRVPHGQKVVCKICNKLIEEIWEGD